MHRSSPSPFSDLLYPRELWDIVRAFRGPVLFSLPGHESHFWTLSGTPSGFLLQLLPVRFGSPPASIRNRKWVQEAVYQDEMGPVFWARPPILVRRWDRAESQYKFVDFDGPCPPPDSRFIFSHKCLLASDSRTGLVYTFSERNERYEFLRTLQLPGCRYKLILSPRGKFVCQAGGSQNSVCGFVVYGEDPSERYVYRCKTPISFLWHVDDTSPPKVLFETSRLSVALVKFNRDGTWTFTRFQVKRAAVSARSCPPCPKTGTFAHISRPFTTTDTLTLNVWTLDKSRVRQQDIALPCPISTVSSCCIDGEYKQVAFSSPDVPCLFVYNYETKVTARVVVLGEGLKDAQCKQFLDANTVLAYTDKRLYVVDVSSRPFIHLHKDSQ